MRVAGAEGLDGLGDREEAGAEDDGGDFGEPDHVRASRSVWPEVKEVDE